MIVSLSALALVTIGLRALLAIMDIHTWTIAWQVVSVPTSLLVVPLEQWSAMERTLAGHLTVADTLAVLLVAAASVIILSSLANARPSQRPPR